MPRYVALFRGINVGKAKRIAMADLRKLLEKQGYTEVKTLLNSGNAVFTAAATPANKLAAQIRAAVAQKLGVDALVIVKSAKDVEGIMAGNRLAGAGDASRLLIAMTHEPRALASLEAFAGRKWGAEKVHVGKHAVYLWCANGILESPALQALFKTLENQATARNWATLGKIHALLAERTDGS
jgi:uncharacterized protein (DUF1697 family)